MKRILAVAMATGALIATAPITSAFGDPGAPGTTFPEQPGANVATGCLAVGTNTGTAGANQSATAAAITAALFADACFGE